MKKVVYYLFLVNIFAFYGNFGFASTIVDTVCIDQVVITATRTPRLLKETPILTRVITAADISKYGRTKFEDILSSELAGIEFHQAGYGTTMSYQGLDARHILVLIDGEKMAGEINGNIDFSRINALSIERIEVMKGSSSVLYGSSAMGATINIITKKAKDKPYGSAQVRYALPHQNNSVAEGEKSNIPNLDAGAFFAAKWGRVTSSTDIKAQSSDPYRIVSKEMEKREYTFVDYENTTYHMPSDNIVYVPIDSSGISVSGWKMLAINQRFGVELSDKLQLNIKGGYYAKERYDLNNYEQNQEEDVVDESSNNYSGYNIDGELIYTINSRHKIQLSAHQNSSKQEEYASGSTTPKQHHQIMKPSLLYNFTHKKGNLIVGLDYNIENLNYDLTESGYSEKKSFKSMSMYAQEEIKLTDKLEITFGVRGLYRDFKSNNIATVEGSDSPVVLTPKFAVTYLLGETTTIRANWSMGYRNPTLKERYIKYLQPYMGSWIVGYEGLVPERNNYFSLSGEYFSKSKKLTLSGMLYMNNFRDKIDTYLDEKENSYVYANTEKTQLIGVEVTGRAMVMNNWWVGVNYAYNHNKETAPTNSAQYIFTSPHTASINTSYRLKVKKTIFNFNLNGRYIGAKEYEDRMPTIIKYSETPVPDLIFGKYNAYNEGYFIMDGAISATFALKYKVILGIDNIFNYKPTVASFNSATTPGIGGSITFNIAF